MPTPTSKKRAKAGPARAAAAPASIRFSAPATVRLRAAGEAGAKKRPTFEILAYNGGPLVGLCGFIDPVIVDLDGLRTDRPRVPILLDHDPNRIVGQAEATIDSQGVRLSGVVTGEDDDAQKVVTHARNGFEWQASIGADLVRREYLEAGETAVVNGREVSGPLLISRESILCETSFVAMGADRQTSATVAASKRLVRMKGAYMTFEQWLQDKGFDPSALNETQLAVLRVAYDSEYPPVPSPDPVEPEPEPEPEPEEPTEAAARRRGPSRATQSLESILATVRREERRKDEITRITAAAIHERPMMVDDIEKMAKLAIAGKTSPNEYELMILRATRAQAGPSISRPSDRRTTGRVIEAAVCLAGGLERPEKHFDERTLNAASDRFPHGIGLRDLLAMAARENGYTGYSSTDVRGLLQAAFKPDLRAEGFSTISLPGILGNVANKFLVAGFNAVESTWRDIASTRPVRDFKAVTSYSLTGGAKYEKVGPDGKLKHATLGEESYSNQAETYGRLFAITRKDIINDDLGALTEVPRKLGRGAALMLNDVFWTEFLDNSTFFASGNSNYQEGATVGTNDSRLNVEGLTRGETLFLNLTDPDGYPVGVAPAILLVPNALSFMANNLMTSTELRDTTANTSYGTSNPHAGKFKVVRSSYLGNSSFTGYSVTAWYLLAAAGDLSVIEVAFLNGREEPIVESADADFGTLGIQFRGYHDFGVAKQEPRAGIKSKGAA